ncbi:acetyl-CoA carboxylase carboxyl transferase subunit alpha [Carnobacterium divergens]|uniref:acetyl-CoA carboxylase carboxyl transferase subunit alpha n=1 Tax=Carnobacterium divergens TaxID=2748 RepID=UPI001071EBCB|nr:acetyl-CoA carboxylase carboxyl transferase subunit alpha [Carnobacterium divergens]TFJ44063.1 acetyl-CoA carboxylase carboxyl transferase subunit alpha [Carnobacterium divergens]TFJ51040.1 acetyl-CoA carboxylase carboxyl transferase subunit alpha [Carnobacterium divergens]
MMTASEIVALARKTTRLTALEYMNFLFNDFIEFHGDRSYRDDKAVVGGIATLQNQPITVIGIQKGHNLEENMMRNFGSPHPEGYRKALRLMKQAEKFGRPVVTFINTAGAYCGVEAEERGQGEAIARNLMEMSQLKVPIIAIIIGEGGSGGALALAMGNQVWMMEHTMYSILSPEGFSSILWKDASRSKEAAELMKLTARDLLGLDVIDKMIEETDQKVLLTQETIMQNLKNKLILALQQLGKLTPEELVEDRYKRFRKY